MGMQMASFQLCATSTIVQCGISTIVLLRFFWALRPVVGERIRYNIFIFSPATVIKVSLKSAQARPSTHGSNTLGYCEVTVMFIGISVGGVNFVIE